MFLHPHPDARHVMTQYRRFILGMKKAVGTARGLGHYRELIGIYLEAKREMRAQEK